MKIVNAITYAEDIAAKVVIAGTCDGIVENREVFFKRKDAVHVRIGIRLHGGNFVIVSFWPKRRSAGGHTTGVLVFCGEEWKSVWR